MLLASIVLLFSSCSKSSESVFVSVKDGQFFYQNAPYTYIGTNFWYGAILASTGQGGDRNRLERELDYMQSIGINNLRILVGSDGRRGVPSKVEPTLQIMPGVYNDTILDGLDYLMVELKERNMFAVLYLNNAWEWSGGYSQYLEWAGYDPAPIPRIDGWPAYITYVQQFVNSDSAKQLFSNYLTDIITRKNRYSGELYINDPSIMSWQIGNEPRAFNEANKAAFATWMSQVSAQIRNLDPNHLISTGSEGKHGCEEDLDLWRKITADPNISYANIHIWPYNWGWVSPDSLIEKLPAAIQNTDRYIQEHYEISSKYGKPLVLEEFGFPRDGFTFNKTTPVTARTAYYEAIFNHIVKKSDKKPLLNGCNFWSWAGFAEPISTWWTVGADYTGDPAQEEQGLNSVFASDSITIDLIKKYAKKIRQ